MKKITIMKLIFTFLIALIAGTTFAQQGINYKAVIKDDLGNVIANDLISVQFSILQGVGETNVYTENHTPTTDANGIIILNIGEGSAVSGDYSTIDWASDTHTLNVQINIGAGLVDLGTTTFKSVPYANHALTSGDNKWVEGTTANDITHTNSGTVEIETTLQIAGTAIIDNISTDGTFTNENNSTIPTQQAVKTYVDTNAPSGLEAIDEGNGIGWRLKGRDPNLFGNIGLNAVDLSFSQTASSTRGATGPNSTAIGVNTTASGFNSISMGDFTQASGSFSMAMGSSSDATGTVSTSMGGDTTASGDFSTAMGRFTIASGESSMAMGNNTEASGPSSTTMGVNTIASGSNSTAMGNGTLAEGDNSTAMGQLTSASGEASTAMGYNTTASGIISTAMGINTTASEWYSTALGNGTIASGRNSTAMGNGTTAPSFSETAIGRQNTSYTPNSTNSWNSSDRLFVVGNGFGSASNALTILKNGNVALGNINPEYILDIDGRVRVRAEGAASSQTAGIWYGNANGDDSMFAGAKTHSATGNSREWGLYINGAYRFWVNGAGNVYANGSLVHSSDRRLKKDIKELSYGLKEVLQLAPKEYFWKDKTQEHASLGLIAQEVEEVIANVVHTGTDDKKTLSLSYTELIPVLINAIKEQQNIINKQNLEIQQQHNDIEALQTLYERVKQIEALLETAEH